MEEKIKFWIVRDAPCSDIKGYLGELNLCSDKPYKDREDDNYWTLETEDGYAIDCIMLPPEMFPDIILIMTMLLSLVLRLQKTISRLIQRKS